MLRPTSVNLVSLQVAHTLSVSLNKIGDLKYYDGDLAAAKSYYAQSLDCRRDTAKDHSDVPSQVCIFHVALHVCKFSLNLISFI